MNIDKILELYRRHDYETLKEEGFYTIGMIRYAYAVGAISKEEADELGEEFF